MRPTRRSLALLCALFGCVYGEPTTTTTTEKVEIFTAEYVHDEIAQAKDTYQPHKTISELVSEQTEAIKKIVSEHRPPPPSVHHELPHKLLMGESIEELKKKCEELRRILDSTTPPPVLDNTERPHVTVPHLERLQPTRPPQMAGNYFIFTQNPEMYAPRTNKLEIAASSIQEEVVPLPEEDDVEEEVPETTTEILTTTLSPSQPLEPGKFKLKYVRLEPLVLQKTLLPNGKSALVWYRLLPTTQRFVQIPDTPDNADVHAVAQPQNYNDVVSIPDQYSYYVNPQNGVITPNQPPTPSPSPPPPPPTTTTTTTTEKPTPPTPMAIDPQPQFFINPQTGMIYQSALPHQFIYHRRVPTPPLSPPTPTTTTTTTTTTTEPPIVVPNYTVEITQPAAAAAVAEDEGKKKKYKHEFRFVIPMVVSGTQEEVSNYPYGLDPYAYLPRDRRPATMNVPVPYVPNYQMIRTLAVPNFDNEKRNIEQIVRPQEP